MAAFVCHGHDLKANSNVFSSTTAIPSKSSMVQLRLNVGAMVHHYVVFREETPSIPEVFKVVRSSCQFGSTVNIDRKTILCPNRTAELHEIVSSKLVKFGNELLREWSGLDSLVQDVIERVRWITTATIMPPRRCSVVCACMNFDYYHFCDERILVQNVLQRSLNEVSNAPIKRASKLAVMEMLKRPLGFDKNHDERCTVCLEELGRDDVKVLCMPCSHRFHGDCILKWLDNSHFCPLCRFEMPTD